jgi:hypothetical protein
MKGETQQYCHRSVPLDLAATDHEAASSFCDDFQCGSPSGRSCTKLSAVLPWAIECAQIEALGTLRNADMAPNIVCDHSPQMLLRSC